MTRSDHSAMSFPVVFGKRTSTSNNYSILPLIVNIHQKLLITAKMAVAVSGRRIGPGPRPYRIAAAARRADCPPSILTPHHSRRFIRKQLTITQNNYNLMSVLRLPKIKFSLEA